MSCWQVFESVKRGGVITCVSVSSSQAGEKSVESLIEICDNDRLICVKISNTSKIVICLYSLHFPDKSSECSRSFGPFVNVTCKNVNDKFNVWKHWRNQFRTTGLLFTSLRSSKCDNVACLRTNNRKCVVLYRVYWFNFKRDFWISPGQRSYLRTCSKWKRIHVVQAPTCHRWENLSRGVNSTNGVPKPRI